MTEWKACKGRRSKKVGEQQIGDGPAEDLLDYTCAWLPLHHSLTPEDCDGCYIIPLITDSSRLPDKIDSLIGANHMLVGQMQAEKLIEYRWALYKKYLDKNRRGLIDLDVYKQPEAKRLEELALDAERKAAGLGRM